MNPDERRATVRSYYDRIDADDYEGVFELFAADVVYDRPGQDAIRGIEALWRFYRVERPLSDGEHEVTAVLVDDDTVAARGRYVGQQNGPPWTSDSRISTASRTAPSPNATRTPTATQSDEPCKPFTWSK